MGARCVPPATEAASVDGIRTVSTLVLFVDVGLGQVLKTAAT